MPDGAMKCKPSKPYKKMNRNIFICLLLLCCGGMAAAQTKSEIKNYENGLPCGEVNLQQQWTESDAKQSAIVYVIDVKVGGSYYLQAVTNLQSGTAASLRLDGKALALSITGNESGWQQVSAKALRGTAPNTLYLSAGRHTIHAVLNGNMPPLIDGISLSRTNAHANLDARWQSFSARLNEWKKQKPVSDIPGDKSPAAEASKVLPNPEGNYEHAIDTAFSYSTFQLIYLTAGTTYTFSTYGSTKDPVLHLFDALNVDTRSWFSDDYNSTWESNLVVTIPVSTFYSLLVRPYYSLQSGTTNIKQNGVDLLTNTPIGGQRLNTTPRTGDLNYFTGKLGSGTNPDTRIFTLSFQGGAVTGYNDDYYNSAGGTWAWGLASRIRKNYAGGSSIVYVCAYAADRTGTCDVYMGNIAATIPTSGEASNFPLLKLEDAIQGATNSGSYNCIAWSGGLTGTGYAWPPDNMSTWYSASGALASFDKFYSNTPVRYPGAWNYTRSGATAANAVVDLWKTASVYTHASVTKPGNNHPHGYDWESKPGSFDRTMHPRNALNNASWYGFVNDYYRFSGSYSARAVTAQSFETDMDAVKAGVAVLDKASLTAEAQDKLRLLVSKTDAVFARQFDELYNAWNKTKAANASLSDPAAYCKNAEFEALAVLSKKNALATMVLVVDKFVNNNDHIIGQLLWKLTNEKYSRLLNEVKAERLAKPNDEQGRYKIHGDHDNGVLYVEKILKVLEVKTADIIPAVSFTVTTSPNPVKDVLTVTVDVKENSRISVSAVSAQTRSNKMLQKEITVLPGTYRYRLNMAGFAGAAGDIITVQVTVNGMAKTVKALVTK
jgi:hypothetical protein